MIASRMDVLGGTFFVGQVNPHQPLLNTPLIASCDKFINSVVIGVLEKKTKVTHHFSYLYFPVSTLCYAILYAPYGYLWFLW